MLDILEDCGRPWAVCGVGNFVGLWKEILDNKEEIKGIFMGNENMRGQSIFWLDAKYWSSAFYTTFSHIKLAGDPAFVERTLASSIILGIVWKSLFRKERPTFISSMQIFLFRVKVRSWVLNTVNKNIMRWSIRTISIEIQSSSSLVYKSK